MQRGERGRGATSAGGSLRRARRVFSPEVVWSRSVLFKLIAPFVESIPDYSDRGVKFRTKDSIEDTFSLGLAFGRGSSGSFGTHPSPRVRNAPLRRADRKVYFFSRLSFFSPSFPNIYILLPSDLSDTKLRCKILSTIPSTELKLAVQD